MALFRNCMKPTNYPQALGQLTALVEALTDAPATLFGDVMTTPQKLHYWLREAMKQEALNNNCTEKNQLFDVAEVYYKAKPEHELPLVGDNANIYSVAYYKMKSKIGDYDLRRAFGRRVMEIRTSKKMSQRDLAAMANVSTGNIANIEQGKYGVSIDVASRIAKALGITITLG